MQGKVQIRRAQVPPMRNAIDETHYVAAQLSLHIHRLATRGAVCFTEAWLSHEDRERSARQFLAAHAAACRRLSQHDTSALDDQPKPLVPTLVESPGLK